MNNDTITHEEIEKAAESYAEENFLESIVVEEPWPSAKFAFAKAFAAGAQFALGKQEKDTVIGGWVARDGDGRLYLYEDRPLRYDGKSEWVGETIMELDSGSFPDLTWLSDPMECEMTVKRKEI